MKIVPAKFEDVNIGDKVYVKTQGYMDHRYDEDFPRIVIAKHQAKDDDRQYIVAAYKGDTPVAYQPYQLGVVHQPVVRTMVLYGKGYIFEGHSAPRATHCITYDMVDDVPDCSSIKMREL